MSVAMVAGGVVVLSRGKLTTKIQSDLRNEFMANENEKKVQTIYLHKKEQFTISFKCETFTCIHRNIFLSSILHLSLSASLKCNENSNFFQVAGKLLLSGTFKVNILCTYWIGIVVCLPEC